MRVKTIEKSLACYCSFHYKSLLLNPEIKMKNYETDYVLSSSRSFDC